MDTQALSSEGSILKRIMRITWIGLLVNIFLSVFKLVMGFLGGSQALVADGFHSMSDLGTDLAILLGAKYWTAPPDDKHPYGHKKIETMVSAAIGIVLAAVGIGIGYDAVISVRETHIVQPDMMTLITALAAIVIKEIMYRLTRRVGVKTGSSALIANAWHNRSDAISSIPVALAISISMISPRWAYVDDVGAIIVCLFILYSSWTVIKPALFELADGGLSSKDRKKIAQIALAVEGVKSVHALRSRRMGGDVFIDLHIMLPEDLSIREGHDISARAKKKILSEAPDVADVIVHMEPYEEAKDI